MELTHLSLSFVVIHVLLLMLQFTELLNICSYFHAHQVLAGLFYLHAN